MIYEVEMTDTFGGEANYSWVQRERIDAPADASACLLVRRAKKALGVTGPHYTDDHNDMIAVRLRHANVAIFIMPCYE